MVEQSAAALNAALGRNQIIKSWAHGALTLARSEMPGNPRPHKSCDFQSFTGNEYRLMAHLSYRFKRVLAKVVGTLAEYDRIDPEPE